MNDLLLLSALLAGPTHGYALKKQIALITGHGEMHNNLVYPLLKGFVSAGWVSRREADGERGQTRELYTLTAKGRTELVRRLSDFPAKAASSPDAFSMRVGLFDILDSQSRNRILDEREKWLSHRVDKLSALSSAMKLGGWPAEIVTHLQLQALAEKKWIAKLRKKPQSM
jgi:DNA-binding PadR family transcriptional regulator